MRKIIIKTVAIAVGDKGSKFLSIKAKYDKTALLVLLALADQANDHGSCWPSVTTIAARARCTERHVRTILRDLEKDGALSVEHRPGTSSVYRINVSSFTTTPEPRFRPEDSSPRNSG